MLHAASTAFDAATLELWGPLANGGTIAILPEHPSPDAVARGDRGLRRDHACWLTAGLFHELVDRRPECLDRVRHLLAGGDVLSPPHVARALAALPPQGRLTNGYGPTETTTFALTHELRPGDAVDGPVPLGRPIQGTSCDVLDAAGRPAPVGMPGELWIGGDGVARGYRGDPELSAERFQPDPERPGGRRYRSGDRARRRPDGTLEFLGRADRQVKVRGVRVEPAEVEARAARPPGYRRRRRRRRRARAPADSPWPPTSSPRRACRRRTRPRCAPTRPRACRRRWSPPPGSTLPRLPLTANGKVDRARLPAPGREHLAARLGAAAARTDRARGWRRRSKRVLGDPLGRRRGRLLRPRRPLAAGGRAVRPRWNGSAAGGCRSRRSSTPRPRAPSPPASMATPRLPRWDNLVALKPQGSRPPLFIVGAGDGNIVGFGQLARELSAEQPLYVLQPSGLDGRHPLDQGIGTMAERYLEKVRSVRPHGPYLLAGRCNGATVAYEMAQRLRAAGEEVPLLVALDSDPPPAGPHELGPGIPYDALMESAWVRARQRGEDVPDLDAQGGRRRRWAGCGSRSRPESRATCSSCARGAPT